MIEVRPFARLGAFRNDWLDTRHHFSFSGYHDPARMGVGALRVWNDDIIAPHSGFDPHPHRDMEIITYVRAGAISHRDSLGNTGRTAAGDVQVMHAGTGITHAEYNEADDPLSLFQIWIMPNRRAAPPGWATRAFPRQGGLATLASGNAAAIGAGALPLYANADLVAGTLATGEQARHRLAAGRALYLVPASGQVSVNGHTVGARDAVAVSDETELTIVAQAAAELVMVDVAA